VVVLVTGPAGCLKSALSFNLMTRHLETHPDEFGVYITLEETTHSHLRNMQSLNIALPENLMISDHSDLRTRFESDNPHPDFLELIYGILGFFKQDKGDKFTCLAIDSLGAMYSLIDTTNIRARMYNFFKRLRELDMTTIVIMETPAESNIHMSLGSEGFLADGIIQMGMADTKQDIALFMQVIKMRACAHSRKKHLVDVTDSGISVLGPLFD